MGTSAVWHGMRGFLLRDRVLMVTLGLLSDDATLNRASERLPDEFIERWRWEARTWKTGTVDAALEDLLTEANVPAVLATIQAGIDRTHAMLASQKLKISLSDVNVVADQEPYDFDVPTSSVQTVLVALAAVVDGSAECAPSDDRLPYLDAPEILLSNTRRARLWRSIVHYYRLNRMFA